MKYEVVYRKPAERFLDAQTVKNRRRIMDACDKLPNAGDRKQLTGHPEYRLRVGDFRILYFVVMNLVKVTVLAIGNRGDVYKRI
ncbi:MAG: type II toxin-antitoxin system RelE/ParE family toxin [Syntrophomonadaceae bacterium]|jgi:mRNA interferase RelE/StbE|nr:type II toxin-antitoxin system RelE/ParE family toxin [Syntrophomonadaceae bacterium]